MKKYYSGDRALILCRSNRSRHLHALPCTANVSTIQLVWRRVRSSRVSRGLVAKLYGTHHRGSAAHRRWLWDALTPLCTVVSLSLVTRRAGFDVRPLYFPSKLYGCWVRRTQPPPSYRPRNLATHLSRRSLHYRTKNSINAGAYIGFYACPTCLPEILKIADSLKFWDEGCYKK